ncbi:lysophospholipid acyltransferase family protein [Robbsia sp. KACC 23696]|uniref:lysophospholipid acyltransferase family protein n=1 Tax=Robbsia sp. KACC 23696 TaxID=3149231 RepID=UPI00325C00CA
MHDDRPLPGGRLDRWWRLLATGLAFVVFGISGGFFSVCFLPLMLLWPHRSSRQRAVTFGIHCFFRYLVAVLGRLRVMYVDVQGAERLRRLGPRIVVANHPTYLDVMVLLSMTPRACCVVKNAHWRNPCFWGIVRAASYVSNADPEALIRDGAKQLSRGYTVIVFPEGTRSPGPDRLHAFSRGFAHMALHAGAEIQPVLLHCAPAAFTKRMRWYDVPTKAFTLYVRMLDVLTPQQQMAAQRDDTTRPPSVALAARRLTASVETLMYQRLKDHGYIEI